MALYQRGKWKITLADLDDAYPGAEPDEVAVWLENIAHALSAGDSEVEALEKSLDQIDNVILAAATIHAIYGMREGLTLSVALMSFGIGHWLVIADYIELGIASGKLDVALRQAVSGIRAESEGATTIPVGSPVSCMEEWFVFYSLALMADAGYPILKTLGLMKDRFSRSFPTTRDLLWQVTKMYFLISNSGYILSEALEATGFSPAIVAAAREAEGNGDLDVAFARWTGYVPTEYAAR